MAKNISSDFAAVVRSRRRALDLTQWDLAAAIGTHGSTVSLIEHGRVLPNPDMRKKIVRVLKIDETAGGR